MINSNREQFNSVISKNSVFKGKLYVSGSLKIEGKFDGELQIDNILNVKEHGKVKTKTLTKAKKFILSGSMIGNIESEEIADIKETGRFIGNITAPILNLVKGSVIKGFVVITGGHKKNIETIIEESFGKEKSD